MQKRKDEDSQLEGTKKLKTDIEDHQETEEVPEEQQEEQETEGVMKLKLGGLGRHAYKKDVLKILETHKVKYTKIKIAPKWTYAVISFENNGDYNVAKSKLDGVEFKGKKLFTKENVVQQREAPPPKEFVDDGRTPEERIADQVTPLWKIPYEEQLNMKKEDFKKTLSNYAKSLAKFFPKKNYKALPPPVDDTMAPLERIKSMTTEQRALEQLDWLNGARKENDGLPCKILDTIASPETEGYRTKCEFTFGRDMDGNKSCGFLLGLYKNGITTVLNPKSCLNVSKKGKEIANILEKYVQQSEYDVYDRVSKLGVYRLALVRTLASGQCLVMVQLKTNELDAETVAKEKETIRDALLEEFKSHSISLDSLLIQEYNDDFNGIKEEVPMEVLYGTKFVTEELLGFKFQISPTSFFQVNPTATELLYDKIRELGLQAAEKAKANSPNAGAVLLDLCCGTGTIGITMAKHFKKVIGVELVAEAIEDAKRNAAANGVTNITYICSKVEDAMHDVFKNHVSRDDVVVAVLDPPRAGVYYSVIKSIRDIPTLKHVVFVACDLKQSTQNLIDLARPTSNKFKGHPFIPVQAIPLDLFPHTNHCEIIVELVRQEPKIAEIKDTEISQVDEVTNEQGDEPTL
ncbi:tRNA methyltransferase 2 [Boothiomyces sp. JEL0866]|nr:tRNA methyltransferase 2 [Boothiomyces sp. JEL0866]